MRPVRVLNAITEPQNQANAAIFDNNYMDTPTDYSNDQTGEDSFYEEGDVAYDANNYNLEGSM